MKKISLQVFILFLIASLTIFYYFLFYQKKCDRKKCLNENEIADFDYIADLYESTGVKLPSNATTTIFVNDKNTNKELFRFIISNVPDKSSSIEIHRCGVYVIRDIFSDAKKEFIRRLNFGYIHMMAKEKY